MCLIIIDEKPETAKDDISVYKVLLRNSNGSIETPYQRANVLLGETYKSALELNDMSVEKGLHSFANKADATDEALFQQGLNFVNANKTVLVVEATIPKGSNYYKGDYCSAVAYTSDTLYYGKICLELKMLKLLQD